MNTITLDTNGMEWVEAASYPSGTEKKVLREDGEVRTILLKLPPGFRLERHSHLFGEQHFVLRGGYEAGGNTYGPGTYQHVPAHADHGPYSSRDGAEILVVWEGLGLLDVGV
jgi:anti-sigma factor ChrR (cupin superfamily)